MNIPTKVAQPLGTCEDCDTPNVPVWKTRGGIIMCADCKAKDDAVIQMHEEALAGNKLLQQLRAVDNQSELKADIFTANMVAITELKGAIWADVNIPDARKQYVYTQECARHFEIQQKKVFDKRQELTAEESVARSWQVAAQEAAGKLTAVEREHFKKLNVSYQPNIKSIKPPKQANKPSPKYKGSEVRDAAAKYGVNAELIRMIMLQRAGMSADDAGKEMADTIARNKAKQATITQ